MSKHPWQWTIVFPSARASSRSATSARSDRIFRLVSIQSPTQDARQRNTRSRPPAKSAGSDEILQFIGPSRTSPKDVCEARADLSGREFGDVADEDMPA